MIIIIFFGGGGDIYSYVYLPIIRIFDTSKKNLLSLRLQVFEIRMYFEIYITSLSDISREICLLLASTSMPLDWLSTGNNPTKTQFGD